MIWDNVQAEQNNEEMGYYDVQMRSRDPKSLDPMRGFKAYGLPNNYNIPRS